MGPACWEWTGRLTPPRIRKNGKPTGGGYGHCSLGNKKFRHGGYAHRLAWILANGPIPKGLWILHKCNNPKCVRVHPEHVYAGTPKDNCADREAMYRAKGIKRGKRCA